MTKFSGFLTYCAEHPLHDRPMINLQIYAGKLNSRPKTPLHPLQLPLLTYLKR